MSDAGHSTMTVDLRSGEAIVMAGVHVEFVHKSGKLARLRVTAPRELTIEKKLHGDREKSVQSRAKHGLIEPA